MAGCAATPPIGDSAEGRAPDPITTRERVEINGRTHGLVIRGTDRSNPILLWVAGGPGGSELGWARTYLEDLEQSVVFVHWDQPGTGFAGAIDWEEATVEDFVQDTLSVTEYLTKRFSQQQVILVGHSWGTIIGLRAVHRRPELYSAYVGVAQQVNSTENDLHGYQLALREAERRGHHRVARRLRRNGPPPYSQDDGGRYLFLFQKVHIYSPHPAPEPRFASMMFPREYRLQDSIHLVRGLLRGVANVYPQLRGLDFETEIPTLDVPVYFFTGRHDETCVQDIAWRYYQNLQAPHKEFIWFENAGHNVPYQDPERFMQTMRERVLESSQHRRNL